MQGYCIISSIGHISSIISGKEKSTLGLETLIVKAMWTLLHEHISLSRLSLYSKRCHLQKDIFILLHNITVRVDRNSIVCSFDNFAWWNIIVELFSNFVCWELVDIVLINVEFRTNLPFFQLLEAQCSSLQWSYFRLIVYCHKIMERAFWLLAVLRALKEDLAVWLS